MVSRMPALFFIYHRGKKINFSLNISSLLRKTFLSASFIHLSFPFSHYLSSDTVLTLGCMTHSAKQKFHSGPDSGRVPPPTLSPPLQMKMPCPTKLHLLGGSHCQGNESLLVSFKMKWLLEAIWSKMRVKGKQAKNTEVEPLHHFA